MKSKKVIVTLSLIFLSILSFAQSVDEILANHYKAMGGKDKISNIKTLKMTGNIDIGPDMKAPFTIFMKDGSKVRFEMELQGMKMVQSLDGDSGWYINPFGGKNDPERMSPDAIRESKEEADFTGPLFNYKQKGNTVELLGKEDMEGTDTYKLKVTKKSGDISYFYLDASSYLELKQTSKHKFEDKESESSHLSSNYKNVDGVMFPFSMEERSSDDASQGQTMNIETVEVNPKIDESIFKMPPMVSAAGTGEKK
jgi:outer membrane lipoprotein-sorting protein